MADHNDHDHGFAHPVPLKLLFGVFFALIILTILTVVTAGQVPAPFGFYVAMAFAGVKGFLVMAFFMHMWWEKSLNVIVFFSSLFFAGLFISLTLLDTSHYQDSIEMYPRDPATFETAQTTDQQ